MEDLLKQVLSDETLYASAKTLFAYLYVCNRECTKYNHEILTEVNIGINAYFRAIRDLECCGYMEAKFHRSETKKPIFVFGDEAFNLEEEEKDKGIYYHKGRNIYEVYLLENGERKYIGRAKTRNLARKLKMKYA